METANEQGATTFVTKPGWVIDIFVNEAGNIRRDAREDARYTRGVVGKCHFVRPGAQCVGHKAELPAVCVVKSVKFKGAPIGGVEGGVERYVFKWIFVGVGIWYANFEHVPLADLHDLSNSP